MAIDRETFVRMADRIAMHQEKHPEAFEPLRALGERLATVDLAEFFDRAVPKGAKGGKKYLSISGHVARNFQQLQRLGLVDCPPKRILDLGAGTGVMGFVAQHVGHDYVALEPTSLPGAAHRVDYAAFMQLFGVVHTDQKIMPMVPLKTDSVLHGRFDYVTAFAIRFNSTLGKYWTADEYMFLLRDLCDRFLVADGRVAFRFNGNIWGQRRRAHTDAAQAYYHAVGEMLEPFAISPAPGNEVVIDPFRRELATDVVLPELRESMVMDDDDD